MKLKNILIGVLAVIISLFTVNNKVNAAAPSTFTVDSLGSIRTLDYLSANFDSGVWVHMKKASNGSYVYCVEIEKSSGDQTYKLQKEVDAKFAYVLANGYPNKSIFGDTKKDYFTTAIAIWYLSASYSNETVYNSIFDDFDLSKGTYRGQESDVVKAVARLIDGANKYSYTNPAISINSTDNNLILSEDGKYYLSSGISVTTTGIVGDYTVSLNNAPTGTIVTDANGNVKNTFNTKDSFYIKVPVSSISELSYEFNASISAVGTTNKAYLYAPDNSNYQSVVVLYSENKDLTATTNFKLNINTEVQISKVDATTSSELPGATLVVKDSTGKVIDEWVSTNEIHVIKGLKPGVYTLTETIAPEGYKLSEETIEFTIKNDGSVTKVEMKNYPINTIVISKQDITTGEEVPGAHLNIKNAAGEVIYAWISSDTPFIIEDELEPGVYTLTETIAPEGYELSTETVTFTVKEDGSVDGMVIMYNKPETIIEVPSTSSFKTMTASLIGIVIIGLGALIIYKNYKKNEEK